MQRSEEKIEAFKSVWNDLRVPVRPGPEGLELYRQQMAAFPQKDILVLGATPELVDMALELGARTVVSVERDPNILEAMRRLGKNDWSQVRLLARDWLEDEESFRGAFNCIVCDGGLLFLKHPEQWDQLFGLVASYLKPGGVFVAKEWAEPVSGLHYESVKEALIEAFEASAETDSETDREEAFLFLASELRVAIFIGATLADGSFDQQLLVQRCDRLIEEMEQRFPEKRKCRVIHAAFRYLARSRPGSTDTIAGVTYDGAAKLLAHHGFCFENFPLPDAPVHGGNYMFVARKK